jgi:hypothetical protein
MGLTPTGEIFVLFAVCGAFVAAFLVSLLPLAARVRVGLIAAGPVSSVVALLIKNPQGLDAIGWLMIAGAGVVAWLAGLTVGYLLRRLFRREEAMPSTEQ